MKKSAALIPINIGIAVLKMFAGLMFHASGLIIYIALGMTLMVGIACLCFGLDGGGGEKELLCGSAMLLALLLGASGASIVLLNQLEKIKNRIESQKGDQQ